MKKIFLLSLMFGGAAFSATTDDNVNEVIDNRDVENQVVNINEQNTRELVTRCRNFREVIVENNRALNPDDLRMEKDRLEDELRAFIQNRDFHLQMRIDGMPLLHHIVASGSALLFNAFYNDYLGHENWEIVNSVDGEDNNLLHTLARNATEHYEWIEMFYAIRDAVVLQDMNIMLDARNGNGETPMNIAGNVGDEFYNRIPVGHRPIAWQILDEMNHVKNHQRRNRDRNMGRNLMRNYIRNNWGI